MACAAKWQAGTAEPGASHGHRAFRAVLPVRINAPPLLTSEKIGSWLVSGICSVDEHPSHVDSAKPRPDRQTVLMSQESRLHEETAAHRKARKGGKNWLPRACLYG